MVMNRLFLFIGNVLHRKANRDTGNVDDQIELGRHSTKRARGRRRCRLELVVADDVLIGLVQTFRRNRRSPFARR